MPTKFNNLVISHQNTSSFTSKWIESLKKQWNLTNIDLICLFCLGLGFIYLATVEPLLVSLFLLSGLFFFSVNRLFKFIPPLGNIIGIKIKFWHLATLIIALGLFFSVFQLPAQALFLSDLEDFVTTLAQNAGTDVSADAIALVFNLIRGIFLVLVAVAAVFAYNQAQQGNDWRPIAVQAAMAFAIILSIDVVTFLFVG